MGAIKPEDFASECVHQGLRFGVHPHYLVAVGQMRSGLNEDSVADRFGPFRVTQTEWDANSADEGFGISDFVPDDVKAWDMQCCIYALMTLRAMNGFIATVGRIPSAVELYQAQWPDDASPMPQTMQTALDATAALMEPAFKAVVGDSSADVATIKAPDVAASPSPNPDKPMPTKGNETFAAKAPGVMENLIADFGLKDFQAAGILGNIGEECDGFREMLEKKPLIPGSKGGFGWAQWTGSRRAQFELFCSTNGLGLFSDAANYGFLKQELSTTQNSALLAVQKAPTLPKAVRIFEATFERAAAGLEHFDKRDDWSNIALSAYRGSADTRVPSDVAKLLDPDLLHRVVAQANAGNATYWVIDQFSDDGGQVLVKQENGQTPIILATDTSIFPLKAGLVIPAVAAQLSKSFDATASTTNPPAGPLPAKNQIAAKILASAQQCDGVLVTRNVPNTVNGRRACAWAVNEVVKRAIGRPVGGGLSSADMGEILSKSQTAFPEASIAPGMIIISPTHGGNIGHVGIVGEIKSPTTATLIYSNSSSRGVFMHSFTLGRWKSYFRDRKGLPVFFYGLSF